MPATTQQEEAQAASETAFYEIHPFTPTAERAGVLSLILERVIGFNVLFPDWLPECPEEDGPCGGCMYCLQRKLSLSNYMTQPNSRFWEVWRHEPEGASEPVGIAYLTNIQPGLDAVAHYAFFDGKLSDKTHVIEELIRWAFEDHSDWNGLTRLTVEIPEHYYALARHAHRKLGFGGPFELRKEDGRYWVSVEGVRRKAFRSKGKEWDTLVMGRLREEGEDS